MKRAFALLLSLLILISTAHITSAENNPLVDFEVGSLVHFGGYDWRVLDVQDGKALIISDLVLEDRAYTTEMGDVTWETCTLRNYLNNEFYDNTFNNSEKTKITETTISNEKNQWSGLPGGDDTQDKIFLLSLEEVVKYFGDSGSLTNRSVGEWRISDKYDAERMAEHIGGTYYYEDGEKYTHKAGDVTWWWLRSPGVEGRRIVCVDYYGDIKVDGYQASQDWGGVRPALWLDLTGTFSQVQSTPTNTPESICFQKGSKGKYVRAIQNRLIELGYLNGTADGDFGKMTEAAVEAFQKSYSLEVTGIVTSEDMYALYELPDVIAHTATEAPKSTEAQKSSNGILTVDNCADLAAMLALKNEFDPSIIIFAKTYYGKTIEFDGNVSYLNNHGDYNTRYDILIYAGDYDDQSVSGPSFQFVDVGVTNLGLSGLYMTDLISIGDNVHIIAKVGEYHESSGLFELKPVLVKLR